MGKGDRRSRRGKLWRGSHGKSRPKDKKHVAIGIAPVKEKKKSK